MIKLDNADKMINSNYMQYMHVVSSYPVPTFIVIITIST